MQRLHLLVIFTMLLTFGEAARSQCFVRADINCLGTSKAWAAKPLLSRVGLLFSKQVQSDSNSCQLFADILKTECQLDFPVQAVFISNGKRDDYFGTTPRPLIYSERSALTEDFRNYFNSIAVPENLLKDPGGANIAFGTAATSALRDFSKVTNPATRLRVPFACVKSASNAFSEICGFTVTCETRNSYNVGETVEITRVRNGVCSESEALAQLMATMYGMRDLRMKDEAVYSQPSVTNFAAFGSMPLVDQTNGYLQGLALEKYAINVVKPGVCLATANTMLGIALKAESPYSKLANRFETLDSDANSNVRLNGSPAQSTKLRYLGYASHVDEMLRAGGIKNSFPGKLELFNQFFYAANTKPRPPPRTTAYYGQWVSYFNEDYPVVKPIQDIFEANYKNWMATKKGFSVGLQSTASTPPKPTDPLVGHMVAGHAVSGSNLVVMDPWNVVTHLQFSDYNFPTFPPVVVPQDQLVACRKQYANSYANACLDKFNGLGNVRNYNISFGPGCSYSGRPPLPFNFIFTNAYNYAYANSGAVCPTEFTSIPGTYRMLRQVGGDAGYVGTQSAAGFATAAYVVGYTQAEPWPQIRTGEQIRADNAATNTVAQSNVATSECSPLTKSRIVIKGTEYEFSNTIGIVQSSGNFSSSSPVSIPCMDLRKIVNRRLDSKTTQLAGIINVTCDRGIMQIVSNSCADIAPAACGKDGIGENYNGIGNFEGVSTPALDTLPFSEKKYISNLGSQCTITKCNYGTLLSEDKKSCRCGGKELSSGTYVNGFWMQPDQRNHLTAPTCQFSNPTNDHSVPNYCASIGGVMSLGSQTAPFCIPVDKVFTTTDNPDFQMQMDRTLQNVVDDRNLPWSEFTPNANYTVEPYSRYLKFRDCLTGFTLSYNAANRPLCTKPIPKSNVTTITNIIDSTILQEDR